MVQTEVDESTYDRLRFIADKDEKPLKWVAREAISDYILRKEGDVEKDPAFEMIASVRLKGRDWSRRKDWRP